MANEARVQSSLSIRKSSGTITQIDYQSRPTAFLATVTGTKGPVPGAITVTTAGTNVSLDELDLPGLCRIANLDASNYVTVGIYDPELDRFYPLADVLPGEFYLLRLSRHLGTEYDNATGTGTSAFTNRLRIRANTASCNVLVEAFEA